MNCSSGCPAVCAYSGSLSRSGPTVPVAPAALSVWQELQGLFLKTAAPETDVFGDEVAFVWPFSHFAQAAAGITIASLRINECPRPHTSVQITGYVPPPFGGLCRVGGSPRTVPRFCPHRGTQNQSITSF